ncbi:MAG TPA: hotdog domain-containing protein [Acidimicrobiia bacterium]|nr:hotdog domain-containing protein [Acidimicrobiia bacterium]
MAATPVSHEFEDDRTPDPRARVSFIAEMGFHCSFHDDVIVGHSDAPASALLVPGSDVVRPSVMLTLADILIGSLANEAVLPRITMTADLNVRTLHPLAADKPFTGEARVLKSGRTTTLGEATFRSDGDAQPAVLSHGTFIASPRPQDTGFSLRSRGPLHAPPGTMTVPFARRVGCRRVGSGAAEIARRDDLLNPADTLQGGLVALVAEEAACALHDDAVPTALDVRYLSAIRVGPARATAVDLGPVTRVEVRDAGADARLAAVAVVRFREV